MNRRLRVLLAGAAVLLLVAVGAGGFAAVQGQRAADEAERAEQQKSSPNSRRSWPSSRRSTHAPGS